MAKPGPTPASTPASKDVRRRGRARSMSDMLPEVGGPAFRGFGFVQSSIVSRWGEIVGARYASISSPESIRFPTGKRKSGVLSLVIEGAHAPMMQHVAPVIIERINRFFGYDAVDRIAIRQGMVQLARAKPRAAPARREIPVALGESLRAISDPELRLCLESLARGVAVGDQAGTAIPVVGAVIREGREGGVEG